MAKKRERNTQSKEHTAPDAEQVGLMEAEDHQVAEGDRNTHMEKTLTVMVKVASPAARRMLGRVKLAGQMNREMTLNQRITCIAMAADSGERLNQGQRDAVQEEEGDRFMTHAPA